jgi:hypothetical protein
MCMKLANEPKAMACFFFTRLTFQMKNEVHCDELAKINLIFFL